MRAAATHIQTASDVFDFLQRYDNFLLDCDGVLWNGSEALEGAQDTIRMLRAMGKRVFFVTNNSTKSRAQYAEKLESLGFAGCTKEEVYCSSYLAAQYLSLYHKHVKKAYVVGEGGIVEELKNHGIAACGASEDSNKTMSDADFVATKLDDDVGAVVCGWDRFFNFYKLCMATLYLKRGSNSTAIRNPNDGTGKPCVFIATNRDSGDFMGGRIMPGGGCMVSAIECASEVTPITVGKPSPWLVDNIVREHNLDRSRTIMVGDRLDTDIMLGVNAGIASLLVLTGVTTLDKLRSPANTTMPDFVVSHFGRLGCAAATPASN
eukprot:GEZU01010724.1.p1 GENE.GEZU01010724.1~~GEZU01010724.1.p1  ORF type:complete len:327 (-),score=71.84 GEZU01010724.1:14-973(-)